MGTSGESSDIRSRVNNLKLVYLDRPQPELLIALPNPFPDRDYEVEAVSPEFTSLCPLNPAQPDYAKVTIKYVPDQSIIELKSLKFYLTSYRTAPIFFEEATNRVLNDLVAAIQPRRMDVAADWNVRGGIGVTVRVSYSRGK